jgi:hypothetical protein
VLALAACGGGDVRLAADQATADRVPAEFRAACGKPGSEVMTERSNVVVKRADCDLTASSSGTRAAARQSLHAAKGSQASAAAAA